LCLHAGCVQRVVCHQVAYAASVRVPIGKRASSGECLQKMQLKPVPLAAGPSASMPVAPLPVSAVKPVTAPQGVISPNGQVAASSGAHLPSQVSAKITSPLQVCPACGNHFMPDALFCRKCGAKRPSEAVTVRTQAAPVALAGYEAARRGHQVVGGTSSSRNVTPQRPPAYAFAAGADLLDSRRSFGPGSVLARPERQVSVASSALQGARSSSPVSQGLASDLRPAVVVTSKQLSVVGASGIAPGALPMRAVYLEAQPSSTAGTATGSIGFPMDDSYASVDTSHASVDNSNEYTFDVGPGEVKRVVRDPLVWEQLRQADSSPGVQGRRPMVKEVGESSTPGAPSEVAPGSSKSPGRTTPQSPLRANDVPHTLHEEARAPFDWSVQNAGQRYIVTSDHLEIEAPEQLRTHPSQGTVRSVSADSSKWARLGAAKKPSWVPAISTPTLFSRREPRNSSRQSTLSPPRSTCSTPRRRRGQCYQDLYADAAERRKKRKEKQEEVENNEIVQIQAERESSLRATRRFQSNDERGLLGRTDDHLRRKAEMLRYAEQAQRRKEEEEIQACTFKPSITHRNRENSPARRQHDEREMERHLRQLAHKQLDVRARLVQLEREWHRTHEKRKALFAERCKEVEKSKLQDYMRMREHEGLLMHTDEHSIVIELSEDQTQAIQVEVDAELQVQKSDVDFWARRRVLIESLEGIECRAAPTLERIDHLAEGSMVLESSGFTIGLAQKVKLLVPDVNDLSSPRTVRSMASNASNGRLSVSPVVQGIATSGSIRSDRHSFGVRSAPSEVGSLATPHGGATLTLGSASTPLGSTTTTLHPAGGIASSPLVRTAPMRLVGGPQVVVPPAVGGVRPATTTILAQSHVVQKAPQVAVMKVDLNHDVHSDVYTRGRDRTPPQRWASSVDPNAVVPSGASTQTVLL